MMSAVCQAGARATWSTSTCRSPRSGWPRAASTQNDPAVVLPAEGGTLTRRRGDDDDIQYDGVVPLVPDGEVLASGLPVDSACSPVAVQQLRPDLIVAAYVVAHGPMPRRMGPVVVRACRSRGAWLDLGTFDIKGLQAETCSPPTVAASRLRLGADGDEAVVVGHSFWDEGKTPHVGWWGAPLQAVQRAVQGGTAEALEWRSVRTAVGTSVRERAACVLLPVY